MATDLVTTDIHGVYTSDGKGNHSLAYLFAEKADAEDEAKRLEQEGSFVAPVRVFVPKEGWRRVFRQAEGRSE